MTNIDKGKTNVLKERYLIDDAREAMTCEEYSFAQLCCKLAIDINDSSFNAHFLNGCALYFSGDLENARKEFTETIRLNPKSQHAKINKSVIESQSGYHSAVDDIENMHPDYVNCVKIFELKAIFFAKNGDYEMADAYFEKTKLLCDSPSAYTNHGTALLEKYLSKNGDVDDLYRAIEQFDHAIENSEFDKYAYYNRCRAYIFTCQYKKAMADAARLVQYDKKDPGFVFILAKTQMLCGKYDKAIENAFYAHWYGSLFDKDVADEALELCDEIITAKNINLYG